MTTKSTTTKKKTPQVTHIRTTTHLSGPTRQIKAGRVLAVGEAISADEAARLLERGLAEDASGDLVGQDLGLLVQQLQALPAAQRAELLGKVSEGKP